MTTTPATPTPTPVPTWTPTRDQLVPHVLCLAAVIVASRRLQVKWHATRSLTVPAPPEAKEAPTDVIDVPATRQPLWRRIKKSRWFGALLAGLASASAQFVVLYLIPKYGAAWMLDLVWGSVEVTLNLFNFRKALEVIMPRPTEISYVPLSPGSTTHALASRDPEGSPIAFVHRSDMRYVMSAVLTALCFLAATYTDSHWATVVLALPGASFALMLSQYHFQRISTRRFVLHLGGSCAVFITVFAAVCGVFWILDKPMNSAPSPDRAVPSKWVQKLMEDVNNVWGYIPPLFLVAMNLRYDQRRVPAAPRSEIATLPTVGPSLWSTSTSPTFMASLVALAWSIALCGLVPEEQAMLVGPFGTVLVTVPIVCAASAFLPWVRGEWAEWWGYEEIYEPGMLSQKTSADVVDPPAGQDEEKVAGGDKM